MSILAKFYCTNLADVYEFSIIEENWEFIELLKDLKSSSSYPN